MTASTVNAAAFAIAAEALENNGFEVTDPNPRNVTYAKWNTSDKGWTEFILDDEFNEVVKEVYAADNRRLTRTVAETKNIAAVNRLVG